MKIACCQLDIVWENKPANFARVQTLLDIAKLPAGTLALLPEMFATGFSMNASGISEGSPSETESFLAEAARQHGIYLLGGVVKAGADGRGRNESVVFTPEGKLLARYCKMQPFNLGGEGQHYGAGDEIVLFHWNGFVVAPFICYDLRFPELFRAAARRGAQLFVVIADWPIMREHHWTTLLRARAIENLAYVAGANQTGKDPKFIYSGRSMIVDPLGEILADARSRESVISVDIELEKVTSWRRDFPALQDIRLEFVR